MSMHSPMRQGHWTALSLSVALMSIALSGHLRPLPVSAQAVTVAAAPQQLARTFQDAFAAVADRVEPSVVTIIAGQQGVDRNPFKQKGFPDEYAPDPRSRPPMARTSTGSGVIIREAGGTVFVLTNNHVVGDRSSLRVRLFNQSEFEARLVGADERSDLAVISFQTSRPLPAGSVARLGDSDRVRVGHWAIAIGSPLDYDSSLTVGVISARGRTLGGPHGGSLVGLLQTDAAINPGNSGGPLVNIDGEVVGLNVAIARAGESVGNIGIGFAIPVNLARAVADQLIQGGRAAHAFLGVQCTEQNHRLDQQMRERLRVDSGGALVEGVQDGSPAARAGLQPGDVIVRFAGRAVTSFSELEERVRLVLPGTRVALEVVRGGRSVNLSAELAEAGEPASG